MKKKIDARTEVEIALEFPYQTPDGLLEKVTMRRPKLKDMIRHNAGADMNLQDSAELIAELCGLVPPEVEEMDITDFEKLQDQLLSFRGLAG